MKIPPDLDIDDNFQRREQEKKWEIIKVIYGNYTNYPSKNKPKFIEISVKDLKRGGIEETNIKKFVEIFRQLNCYESFSRVNESFKFYNINHKILRKEFLNNKFLHEEIFGKRFQEKQKEKNSKKESITDNDNPHCIIENGYGFLRFGKYGKKNKIGKPNTRPFKLLQCLLGLLGTAKTVDMVFEAIRTSKDKKDPSLTDFYMARTKKITIIQYTIKELQKGNKLSGKLQFKWDEQKTKLWLNYSD